MSDSPHLNLPYLEPAQAQKHVTVNEALMALDVLVALCVLSRTLATPPSSPAEGDRYLLPSGVTGAWAGQTGRIAAWMDGGWMFFAPQSGWSAFVANEGVQVLFNGTLWVEGPRTTIASVGASGASTRINIIEIEHSIVAGSTNTVALSIPDRAIVLGITARVSLAITGATSWSVGVSADATRYGNSIGVALNSTLIGVSGTPTAYYGATPLLLTAAGGSFTGGKVKLAIHYFLLSGPT